MSSREIIIFFSFQEMMKNFFFIYWYKSADCISICLLSCIKSVVNKLNTSAPAHSNRNFSLVAVSEISSKILLV